MRIVLAGSELAESPRPLALGCAAEGSHNGDYGAASAASAMPLRLQISSMAGVGCV